MRIDEIEREFKETERNLAQANELFQARRFKDAHPLFEKVFPQLKASFGAEDSRTLSCLSSLGDTCYELRRFEDAARHYHKVLAVRERKGELKDHEYPSSLFKLAKAYAQVPRAEEAIKYFKRAAKSAREVLLAGDPLIGNILEAHAGLLHRMGNGADADALREEARMNRQMYGSSSQVVDRYMQPLGMQFQTIPPGMGFQTIPPGMGNFAPEYEPEPKEKAAPKKTMSALGKMLSATFIAIAVLGVILFLLITFGPKSDHRKIEYITDPEIAPQAAPAPVTTPAQKTVVHRAPPVVRKTVHVAKSKPAAAHIAAPVKSSPAPAPKPASGAQWNNLKNLREYN